MKRLLSIILVAVFAAHAPAQVITTVKSYRENITPSPPSYLVQGEDGALYGIGSMLYRLQPDGSGLSVLTRGGIGGPLSISGSTLYGMASTFKVGKINTDGSGYTVFAEDILAGNPLRREQITQSGSPGLVLSGNTLYGWGFKINTDGTGYSELAGFPEWDGLQDWYLDFEVSDNYYFGSTSRGGLHGAGTVFRLNLDGSPSYTMNVVPGDESVVGGWLLKAVGDTVYGYGFPDRMFKVNADGSGYSVLQNQHYPNVSFPEWADRLSYFDGAFYWVSRTFANDRTTNSLCKMNPDGTGFSVLKSWSHDLASSFFVQILMVAGGGIYGGVGPNNVPGEEGGFLFRINTDGSGFAVLHEFTKPNMHPDGSSPEFLTASDGVLYGVDSSRQRLFRMNGDGTGFTSLKEEGLNNVDRFYPISRPTVSGSMLFGVGGGRGPLQTEPPDASVGLVYRMNTDGNGYTVLKDFTVLADNYEAPTVALVHSGSALYGLIGGNGGNGSHGGKIFKLNTDGSGYQVLRTFGPTATDPATLYTTNSDGLLTPYYSELTTSGSTLYGAAPYGGPFGYGTVFKMNTNGTGFTVLKHFTQETPNPIGRLALSGDILFGISKPTFERPWGKLFRVNTNGTGFLVVKEFPDAVWDNNLKAYTNSDGVNPIGGLAIWGNTLYGTTSHGGEFGMGTLFKLHTDGTGFAVLQHLKGRSYGSSGGDGLRDLVLSGSSLYGPSFGGGDDGVGAIYRIDLLPTLSIQRTGANSLAVTWPSVWTDFVLQQNVNGLSSVNWSNVPDAIQDDGTKRTISVNPSTGTCFYRLVEP